MNLSQGYLRQNNIQSKTRNSINYQSDEEKYVARGKNFKEDFQQNLLNDQEKQYILENQEENIKNFRQLLTKKIFDDRIKSQKELQFSPHFYNSKQSVDQNSLSQKNQSLAAKVGKSLQKQLIKSIEQQQKGLKNVHSKNQFQQLGGSQVGVGGYSNFMSPKSVVNTEATYSQQNLDQIQLTQQSDQVIPQTRYQPYQAINLLQILKKEKFIFFDKLGFNTILQQEIQELNEENQKFCQNMEKFQSSCINQIFQNNQKAQSQSVLSQLLGSMIKSIEEICEKNSYFQRDVSPSGNLVVDLLKVVGENISFMRRKLSQEVGEYVLVLYGLTVSLFERVFNKRENFKEQLSETVKKSNEGIISNLKLRVQVQEEHYENQIKNLKQKLEEQKKQVTQQQEILNDLRNQINILNDELNTFKKVDFLNPDLHKINFYSTQVQKEVKELGNELFSRQLNSQIGLNRLAEMTQKQFQPNLPKNKNKLKEKIQFAAEFENKSNYFHKIKSHPFQPFFNEDIRTLKIQKILPEEKTKEQSVSQFFQFLFEFDIESEHENVPQAFLEFFSNIYLFPQIISYRISETLIHFKQIQQENPILGNFIAQSLGILQCNQISKKRFYQFQIFFNYLKKKDSIQEFVSNLNLNYGIIQAKNILSCATNIFQLDFQLLNSLKQEIDSKQLINLEKIIKIQGSNKIRPKNDKNFIAYSILDTQEKNILNFYRNFQKFNQNLLKVSQIDPINHRHVINKQQFFKIFYEDNSFQANSQKISQFISQFYLNQTNNFEIEEFESFLLEVTLENNQNYTYFQILDSINILINLFNTDNLQQIENQISKNNQIFSIEDKNFTNYENFKIIINQINENNIHQINPIEAYSFLFGNDIHFINNQLSIIKQNELTSIEQINQIYNDRNLQNNIYLILEYS